MEAQSKSKQRRQRASRKQKQTHMRADGGGGGGGEANESGARGDVDKKKTSEEGEEETLGEKDEEEKEGGGEEVEEAVSMSQQRENESESVPKSHTAMGNGIPGSLQDDGASSAVPSSEPTTGGSCETTDGMRRTENGREGEARDGCDDDDDEGGADAHDKEDAENEGERVPSGFSDADDYDDSSSSAGKWTERALLRNKLFARCVDEVFDLMSEPEPAFSRPRIVAGSDTGSNDDTERDDTLVTSGMGEDRVTTLRRRSLLATYVLGSLLLVHRKLLQSLPGPVANLLVRSPTRTDVNASLIVLPTSRLVEMRLACHNAAEGSSAGTVVGLSREEFRETCAFVYRRILADRMRRAGVLSGCLAFTAHAVKAGVRSVPLPPPLGALRGFIVNRLVPNSLIIGAVSGVVLCAAAGEDGIEIKDGVRIRV